MESWFNTLKLELGERFESATAAERDLFDFIEVFYNGSRRHSSLGNVSPREFERVWRATVDGQRKSTGNS
jgi:putative transposase